MPVIDTNHERGYETSVFLVLTLPRISLCVCVEGEGKCKNYI